MILQKRTLVQKREVRAQKSKLEKQDILFLRELFCSEAVQNNGTPSAS